MKLTEVSISSMFAFYHLIFNWSSSHWVLFFCSGFNGTNGELAPSASYLLQPMNSYLHPRSVYGKKMTPGITHFCELTVSSESIIFCSQRTLERFYCRHPTGDVEGECLQTKCPFVGVFPSVLNNKI